MGIKEDEMLLRQIQDKIRQCENQNRMISSPFLDAHQQSVVRNYLKGNPARCRVLFSGGCEDSDRVIMLCLPDYAEEQEAVSEALMVLRASHSKGSKASRGGRELTHRDYLGSILGLGIRREMVGDILVRPDGADILVLREMADYLEQNLGKAGRSYLSTELVPLEQLIVPERSFKTKSDTVASPRLDSITASAFGMSRSKAQEAIRRGLVFLNNMEVLDTDHMVEEGDKLVLRHRGRVDVLDLSGRSRKGRVYAEFRIYE